MRVCVLKHDNVSVHEDHSKNQIAPLHLRVKSCSWLLGDWLTIDWFELCLIGLLKLGLVPSIGCFRFLSDISLLDVHFTWTRSGRIWLARRFCLVHSQRGAWAPTDTVSPSSAVCIYQIQMADEGLPAHQVFKIYMKPSLWQCEPPWLKSCHGDSWYRLHQLSPDLY